MKTPKQWVDENTQSGAFDCVHSCKDAEALVAEIQKDAIDSALWEISKRGGNQTVAEFIAAYAVNLTSQGIERIQRALDSCKHGMT